MIETIRTKLQHDLERVENLIEIYDQFTPGGSGRRRVAELDILRAAVAFLHAALEGLLRELLRHSAPGADIATWRDELGDMPLPGLEGKKFHLYHLAYHRGRTIDDVIEEAVDEYLDESNFNNIGEIKAALRQLELDDALVERYTGTIGPLMKRRHHIVHQFDTNRTQEGSGHHTARSLARSTVQTWLEAVGDFGHDVLDSADENEEIQ